jgi:CCR4-NOT transcription complex subunit 3
LLNLSLQEETFDEDEGIYDEFHLDEEEEKFGLAADDGDSVISDEASEGSRTSISRSAAVDHISRSSSVPFNEETR